MRRAWLSTLATLALVSAGPLGAADPPTTVAAPPDAPIAATPIAATKPAPLPPAAQLVADFRGARIGRELGPTLPTNGTGRFRLAKATPASQILDGAGRPMGYLFGAATLEYDIEPSDEAVVHDNIPFVAGLKVPEKGKPLVIEATDVAWISLEGPAPDPAAVDVRPPNETLARALDPRVSGGFSPAISLAAARLSGNTPDVFVMARIGPDHFLTYGFDTETGREGLYGLKKPRWEFQGREGWMQGEMIDERPVGRSRQTVDPIPSELRGIDIKIVEREGEMGDVTATLDYGFLRHAPSLLKLGWVSEALDVRSPARVRRLEGSMTSVTDADGRPLPFVTDRDVLLVQLPKHPRPGDVVRLKFAYRLPLIRYAGDEYWRLGEQSWYPMIGGDLRRNAARMRAEVHALKPFTAWGTGKVVKRWEEGNHACVLLEEPKAGWFPVVGAGKFFPYEMKDRSGRTISIVSYAMERPEGQQRLAKLFAGLVEDYYEKFYPKFPFDYLTIVEANDWGFGQAPAGYINITKEAFNPLTEEISRMYSKYSNEIFAHEIGHAWWGHYFRAVSTEDQWLEESFAEYSCALVLEWARKKGDMDRKSREWKKSAAELRAPLPIVAANRLGGPEAGIDRQKLLYNKGPWVLHCLRSEIGDKAFFVTLKAFLLSFEGKVVRTEDFLGILNAVTKKDWRPWFDRYVYGPETPSLKEG